MKYFIDKVMEEFGLKSDIIEEIRNKNGIYLYRLHHKSGTCILKYFDQTQAPLEIEYYSLLRQAGIPTPQVIAVTERAVLMEDLCNSPYWRLAVKEDMEDPVVARNLAHWYKALHNASGSILATKDQWYSEYSLLTVENLRKTAKITETSENQAWEFIIEHLHQINQVVKSLDPVVNYNDFYYTNLAVSRTERRAMMFDYNCMGKGYRAADLRNVCVSLSSDAAEAFLESYGRISDHEFRVDSVVSTLTTLVMATQHEQMPSWANDSFNALKSGKLTAQLREILCDDNIIAYMH